MQIMNSFRVSVIVPCYNEEDNIPLLTKRIISILSKYDNYEIIFIDDGSVDNTLDNIQLLSEHNVKIKYISFSRNFGQQMALKAGYDHASGDCVISMDADLQHPPELIDKMIEKWKEGYDVLYAVREENKNISFLKRVTSKLFYSLISKLSGYKIEQGISDFRLIDRKIVTVLNSISESSLFIRGLMPWIGFKQHSIKYEPEARRFGKSKYSIRKMLLFALDGITAFSLAPLRLSIIFGLCVFLFSTIFGIYEFILNIITHHEVSNWKIIVLIFLFCSGLQLLMLGIVGEYLGRIFVEIKQRPLYIINKTNI
jgi:dolichol-phosphate mannosyltransferase